MSFTSTPTLAPSCKLTAHCPLSSPAVSVCAPLRPLLTAPHLLLLALIFSFSRDPLECILPSSYIIFFSHQLPPLSCTVQPYPSSLPAPSLLGYPLLLPLSLSQPLLAAFCLYLSLPTFSLSLSSSLCPLRHELLTDLFLFFISFTVSYVPSIFPHDHMLSLLLASSIMSDTCHLRGVE